MGSLPLATVIVICNNTMDNIKKPEEKTTGDKKEKETKVDKTNVDKISIMENPLSLPLVSSSGTPASGSALGSLMAMTAMSGNSMMSMMGLQVGGEDKGPKLNPEDIELYKQAFDEFDRNKDGTISIGVTNSS